MYTIPGKQLVETLTRVLDIISLGDTSSNQTVRIDFGKDVLTFGVQNSAGTYRSTLSVESNGKPGVKQAIVPADVLLSYVKGKETVVLIPNKESLEVTSKRFKATLFYIGSDYDLEIDEPNDGSLKIGSIKTFVTEALLRTSDMKDRVEQKNVLLANMVCNKSGHFFTVGDTHHIVLISNKAPVKREININMSTSFMKKVFGVGGRLTILPTRVVAVNDAEYLSLNSTADGEAISVENVQTLLNLKPITTFVVDKDHFLSSITTLLAGTDAGTHVTLSVKDGKMTMLVKTGSSNASMSLKVDKQKGSSTKKNININHLVDCLKTMKGRVLKVNFTDNMVCLRQNFDLEQTQCDVFAAISVVAE